VHDPRSQCDGDVANTVQANTVQANVMLAPNVHRLDILAPRIAQIRQPGQFVIVRRGPGAERIPLTIAEADPDRGTISLIIQALGKSTQELIALSAGQAIADLAGPLGCPSELVLGGHAICIGGGVGTAVVYPIAQSLHRGGSRVTAITGARTADGVLLEKELSAFGRVMVCTDDGSYGHPGRVTEVLGELLAAGEVTVVYAAGPVVMMAAVAELTRPLGIRTIVSLNPIMVDGTGMCGGCRVTIGGQVRFACIEGPEFDGHKVDFAELADRLGTYGSFEREAILRAERLSHD
jgi:ferredoxin/flavodoxin---NADP+ reductase